MKSKLADNIEKGQIKTDTWLSRIMESPPDGLDVSNLQNKKLAVVKDNIEQYPSFVKVLMANLDYALVQVYIMLFFQLELA